MTEPVKALYIHIPYCISKCAYCDFFSKAQGYTIPDDYVTALCNEIKYRIKTYKIKELQTIYIGGGTPSLLSSSQFDSIFNCIKNLADINPKNNLESKPDIEITVEVNPDDLSENLLETLASCGVTRISCGIQSMSNPVLKRACRRAGSEVNRKALKLLKEKWQGQLSLDLISALPEESQESFLAGLKEVVAAEPDHISLYSLTIEETTPFGRQLDSGQLSYDFDAADKLWLKGRDFLEEQGYRWYEVSNFSKPGKECRHNLIYWTHQSYLGCGSGACGTIYKKDGSGIRWTNTTELKKYISFWHDAADSFDDAPCDREEIDGQTSRFEFFMMGLRKLEGISKKEYEDCFGEELPEKFLEVFGSWQEKGLCYRTGLDAGGAQRFAMSREGMLFLNRFNMELL